MPARSDRVFATQVFRFSKEVDVPLRYAYGWLTDFRPDDGRLSARRPRFRVLRISPRRVVRIRVLADGGADPSLATELIRLRPPDAWHVDQVDETDLAAVDYRLARRGPRRTRVSLVITERWMTRKHPSHAEYQESVEAYWDHLLAALAADYRAGRPAVGRPNPPGAAPV